MIVDKISMVEQEMLFNIGKLLAKARDLSNSYTVIFRSLLIIIVMGDFYEFSFIADCALGQTLN